MYSPFYIFLILYVRPRKIIWAIWCILDLKISLIHLKYDVQKSGILFYMLFNTLSNIGIKENAKYFLKVFIFKRFEIERYKNYCSCERFNSWASGYFFEVASICLLYVYDIVWHIVILWDYRIYIGQIIRSLLYPQNSLESYIIFDIYSIISSLSINYISKWMII